MRVRYMPLGCRNAGAHRTDPRPAVWGSIDVLIGINLLREGLEHPRMRGWWRILDADKEGFLRSENKP